MPCIPYWELIRGKWVFKILIVSDRDKVIYDGEFNKKDQELLKLIEEYSDDFERFKQRYLKEG